ncbi:MAG: nicotinate (nicotinamide) nucleotide adenylyltransferase [Planctomycetes bacterium]|nr:nicotinate (nicotinamide) nucleotide adenylyltransferase [Planctomycetota bacterium]
MEAVPRIRRIGLFGGSFDPPHLGHLHVARAALGRFALDRLVFVPAAESPFKPGRRLASGAERVALLRLLLADEPRCEISELELARGGRSYTIDTVRALPAALGEPADCAIYLLLGSDNLAGLPGWREARALLERVEPVVVRREGTLASEISALAGRLPEELLRKLERGALDLPPVRASSTELREMLPGADLDARLLPPTLLEYIRAHGLYGVPHA